MTDPTTLRPVAVVTGGARGIGLAIGRWFLARNHGVALIDIDADTLSRTERELADPERVLAVHADVSQPDQVARAIALVDERFGRIDALVNNAGVAVFKPILDTSYDEWRHVLGTNLDGAFLCTQAAAPVMLREGRGGAVVNIASISGLRASTLRVAYGTSKGALIHLTKQQAIELGNAGIRVNAIAPGFFLTEQNRTLLTNPDGSYTPRAAKIVAHTPMRRFGEPEELLGTLVWLANEKASGFVSGIVVPVDGGFNAYAGV